MSRFLTLADVCEVLNISTPQAYTLVRNGDLPAIQVGGRGVWRVEAVELEAYIARLYAQNRARAAAVDAGVTAEPDVPAGSEPSGGPGR